MHNGTVLSNPMDLLRVFTRLKLANHAPSPFSGESAIKLLVHFDVRRSPAIAMAMHAVLPPNCKLMGVVRWFWLIYTWFGGVRLFDCHSAECANVILDIFLLLLSAPAKMMVCNRIFLLLSLTSINLSAALCPWPSPGVFGLCAVKSIFAR